LTQTRAVSGLSRLVSQSTSAIRGRDSIRLSLDTLPKIAGQPTSTRGPGLFASPPTRSTGSARCKAEYEYGSGDVLRTYGAATAVAAVTGE
jgi:hypothetical protein